MNYTPSLMNMKTCPVASKSIILITTILDLCIGDFSENISTVDFNKRVRASQENTNILQGEDDEGITLGMPMQPQQDDKEEQKKEDEDEKIISLGCPCNAKNRMEKNKWRENGVTTHLQLPTMVTHKLLRAPLLILLKMILYVI
jgi:hypothetical protein